MRDIKCIFAGIGFILLVAASIIGGYYIQLKILKWGLSLV